MVSAAMATTSATPSQGVLVHQKVAPWVNAAINPVKPKANSSTLTKSSALIALTRGGEVSGR